MIILPYYALRFALGYPAETWWCIIQSDVRPPRQYACNFLLRFFFTTPRFLEIKRIRTSPACLYTEFGVFFFKNPIAAAV